MASMADADYVTNKNLYILRTSQQDVPLELLVGILNSRVISYLYVKQVTQAVKDDFPQVTIKDVKGLPWPPSIDKSRHDKMVRLVERMLDLNKRLQEEMLPDEKEKLERQIKATDDEIDRLVYELYGLTEDEIRIVEHGS